MEMNGGIVRGNVMEAVRKRKKTLGMITILKVKFNTVWHRTLAKV